MLPSRANLLTGSCTVVSVAVAGCRLHIAHCTWSGFSFQFSVCSFRGSGFGLLISGGWQHMASGIWETVRRQDVCAGYLPGAGSGDRETYLASGTRASIRCPGAVIGGPTTQRSNFPTAAEFSTTARSTACYINCLQNNKQAPGHIIWAFII